MANFDEEKAKEIIQKNNLDAKTLAVWRTRNKIPDKYFKEKINIADRDIARMRITLKSEKINISALKESAKFPKLYEFINSDGNISEDEYKRVKTTLNKIKVDGLKIVTEINKVSGVRDSITESIRTFLKNNPELKISLVLEKKFLDFKYGKIIELNREDYRLFADRFSIFAMELQF